MKELYIPYGKTVHMSHVEAGNIILKGALEVDGVIKARKITGNGILKAGHISAKTVVAADIDAGTLTAERVAANRVVAVELCASRAATVNGYLRAEMVHTPKLSVCGYEVEELKAKKLIHLPERSGALLWTVLTSELRTTWVALRTWWEELTGPVADGEDVVDADYVAVSEEPASREPFDWDNERARFIRMFDFAKERGYVLRVCTQSEAKSPIADVLREQADRLKDVA